MTIDDVKAYCRSLPGAQVRDTGPPYNILLYTVGGRQFAYFKTSEPERWRFSFRATPDRFLELTDQPGIKPARYMQRFHWVTVVDVAAMDAGYLKELIAWSHQDALGKLSRRARAALVRAAHPTC